MTELIATDDLGLKVTLRSKFSILFETKFSCDPESIMAVSWSATDIQRNLQKLNSVLLVKGGHQI